VPDQCPCGCLEPNVDAMRSLFTSTNGLGHLYPMLPLARAVQRAGDDVLFAVPGNITGTVRQLGFNAAATSSGEPSAETKELFDRALSQADPSVTVLRDYFAGTLVREGLEPMLSIIRAVQPDVIVSENLEACGPLAAEHLGIPHVSLGTGPIGLADTSRAALAEGLDVHRQRLGLRPAGDETWLYRHLFTTPFPHFLQAPDTVLPNHTVQFRHEDPEGVADAHPRWSQSGRPAVYASLGTVAGGQESLVEAHRAVLRGLGHADADVLFTIGRFDPAELGSIPDNVTLATHLTPAEAMACDLVLTHAGAGTVTTALSRGLPMVAVPLFADQPGNAGRVADLGAGVVVSVADAGDELPEAIARVATDPSYRASARALAGVMAAAPPADVVVPRLVGLADLDAAA
jgi:UDP:flavonoid glycosyltransferase YjiC (YdhE family)